MDEMNHYKVRETENGQNKLFNQNVFEMSRKNRETCEH